jgi:molybdopterin converting factor small subunit
MHIEVKLFFDLVKYLPPGSKNKKMFLSLKDGSSVQALLYQLNLPAQVTKIVLVNGITPTNGMQLKEGDVVAIFPPIAGG